jgi:REP element-mobilizing transposase RayT
MPRDTRPDYPGATHHVFVRGVARSVIAVDEDDYRRTIRLLERTVSRYEVVCHAWCLMPNHSHLLLTSRKANISRAMQWFGSRTAQTFNERHDRTGHLYQGRFGSRLVETDRYFLELTRYIALNPSRAGLCEAPEEWLWSSYAATAGALPPPKLLDTRVLTEKLGSTSGYADWIAADVDEKFLDDDGIPLLPPRPPLETLVIDDLVGDIAIAHYRHGYSMTAIAKHLGVSHSQISRRLAARIDS